MKTVKKGDYFKAYCTEKNEGGTCADVGAQLGTISIITEKFVGSTACIMELYKALENYKIEARALAQLSTSEIVTYLRECRHKAVSIWSVDDVFETARNYDIELTEEQAREVIQVLDNRHDANIGINWDVIIETIDTVLSQTN